jgi:hypothetical protein
MTGRAAFPTGDQQSNLRPGLASRGAEDGALMPTSRLHDDAAAIDSVRIGCPRR